jgi:predicted phage baseplate assembly protein
MLRKTSLGDATLRPRNPLPAAGGQAPEAMADIRLFAPYAFRSTLQRAVPAEDYAALAEDYPGVQGAAAELRWTGSWVEVRVGVDALGADEPPPGLLEGVEGMLHRYRRIGHDLRVLPAHQAPLDITLEVCVLPDFLRGHVKAALLQVFGNRRLPDGTPGLFHPDSLSFGEGIFLSRLVAAAQAVPGVESVSVTQLERLFEGPNGELDSGVLPLGPLEIARLDNDPGNPENGQLHLVLRGGR